ncbi:sensor histidine kinase [Streptococcus acidominimus]|uniref:histidine kinase n=1 Tax=Streptococcus acidominimus TaxID=1326 RepID=A0A1Q8EFZ9_STRAI|nr:HAMP domain-containing sensor histidine kinase [Streptococcus acidominimus]MBF0846883.1 HAMP domain-containing histidine kinase [Streptococcus danieliae]MBF0818370.1 HAMP domain-containing histidine kinase [Streptococcus acidominimus]MBF0838730.1 HAMP domain-containing histidine kinase [Streptococcus acidominimus]OLF50714.1 two-component sensor histidine kinase [Streptococcus acidominimus]TFU31280.1 HAMP domain-containing histidine kinase [Streptococcus acidominimus]
MLIKFRKLYYTDNFSYFIRYFAVFTLIFSLMTVIIFQLMRSTMYRGSDENFKEIASDPEMMMEFARARGLSPEAEIVWEKNTSANQANKEKKTDEANDEEEKYKFFYPTSKIRLNANYHVVLYDSKGNRLNQVDYFSGLSSLQVNKESLDSITECTVTTPFGEKEYYRCMTIALPANAVSAYTGLDLKYATILFNTSQIKSSIASYESTVMFVMIGFWLISIVASIYLSNVSMRPILASFQKQKEFVENASHELRTPLTVLQNRLESLFRHPEATIMDSSENIASSLAEVRNMRLLTTNLLNLARRDDGLKPEIVAIQPTFFDELLANYAIMAEENGKLLTAQNQVKEVLHTDKILLKQLMTILVDNAMKYTEDDGHIWIDILIKDRFLVLKVADNGLGISPENKKKIFDRFYRVDKARTRQKGGFGLGLSLAKQIIETLHGTISVQDRQPKGSLFEVHLPK